MFVCMEQHHAMRCAMGVADNDIGAEGATSLSVALKRCSELTKLYLNGE